jgi:hypothetical protein
MQHPAWSAAMAGEAGASAAAQALIRHHQDRDAPITEVDPLLLAALQQADDAN